MHIMYYAIMIAVGFGLFILWDSKFKKKDAKIRILLFEQVGDEKVFMGAKEVAIKNDEKLGFYINITKKVAIQVTSHNDFFYDRKFGKCLEVVKFSEDDYRPISRMDKHLFGILKTKEVAKLDENGEPIYIKDSDGKILTDENGEQIFETEKQQYFEPYDEPKGITQTAREAQTFQRSFHRRMEELRKVKGGFWDKYGVQVLSVGLVIVVMLFLTHMTNKSNETLIEVSENMGQSIQSASEAMNKPSWVEGLVEKINRDNAEANAPPK